MAVLASLLVFLTTLAGGLTAMRVRDRRHLVLGFAGGLMLGVVAFDLIPESLEMTPLRTFGVPAPMIGFAAGFLLLHVVEQAVAIHRAHEEEYAPHVHGGGPAGLLAASALVLHSMMDGLSIGLGFQSGTRIGVFVTVAVIAHAFADGFNAFTAASLGRSDRRPAVLLLLAAAAAPVAGAAIGTVVAVPEGFLGSYLGFYAGVLLYLAAAEILPEAHSAHPRLMTLGATGAGLLAILLSVGLVG